MEAKDMHATWEDAYAAWVATGEDEHTEIEKGGLLDIFSGKYQDAYYLRAQEPTT